MEVTFQRRWGSSGSGKEQAGEMPREAPRAGDTAGATQQPSVSCIPRQLGPAAPYIPIHSAPWHPAAPCIPIQLGPAASCSTLHPDTAGSCSIPQHPASRDSWVLRHPAAPCILIQLGPAASRSTLYPDTAQPHGTPQHPSSRSTPHPAAPHTSAAEGSGSAEPPRPSTSPWLCPLPLPLLPFLLPLLPRRR